MCEEDEIKIKVGQRPPRNDSSAFTGCLAHIWLRVVLQLKTLSPPSPGGQAGSWASQCWVFSGSRVQAGAGGGAGGSELLSFPSLPPSFLLSWQRLYPVALNKAQEKGQQQVIVPGMKTNESLFCGAPGILLEEGKDNALSKLALLTPLLKGSPLPFPVQHLSAPKPPLPEESLDARVRYVVRLPPPARTDSRPHLGNPSSKSPALEPWLSLSLPQWPLPDHFTPLGLHVACF